MTRGIVHRLIRFTSLAGVLLAIVAPPVAAEGAAGPPFAIGDLTVSGSVRTRAYTWRWFGDDADGEYSYPATLLRARVWRTKKACDWQPGSR